MDRQRLFGREIEVEFARGDRKSKSFKKKNLIYKWVFWMPVLTMTNLT